MGEYLNDTVKVIIVILIFIIALSLTVFLFLRLRKKSEGITFNQRIFTGKSVANIYKALIIFAIILIAIFIVMLGVLIYNNVYGFTEDAINVTQKQVVEMHNMNFENYFGNNVSGSQVRSLMQNIQTNNRQAISQNEEVGNLIYVRLDGEDITNSSEIKIGKRYRVNTAQSNKLNNKEEYGAGYWKNGYLKSVEITTIED